jgi:predicted DsbA family dithiol-disulfide isomerase
MRMTPIEVFADVCCPFTHVGLRRLVDRREALSRPGPRLRVRAWPLELVNGAPLDPEFIAEEVEALREQVAPDLFRRFDVTAFPDSSLPAFAVAAVAYAGDLATGEAVSLDLRSALFEDGRNIADRAVLAEITTRHGLPSPSEDDERQAVQDWHDGQTRGVLGSPHFFLAGGDVFCPTLEIHRTQGRLRITVDEETLRSFYQQALGI